MKVQSNTIARRQASFFLAPLRLCAIAVIGCGLLPACALPRRSALALHTTERFSGRADGLVWRETWKDAERGGGLFLLSDPNVQTMYVNHTNQAALGGGSVFTAGSLTLVVDTNTAAILGAGGTALGNVIGASVKAAVK
jgi:hypothetical protein